MVRCLAAINPNGTDSYLEIGGPTNAMSEITARLGRTR